MRSAKKKYAIIVAGGSGTRMGGTVPKQFLPLMGVPVLCHSILSFAHAIPNIKIILVVPGNLLDGTHTILKSYLGSQQVTTVKGGETRFHSVQNGLKAVNDDGIVFIHDGARPLVSRALIHRCYEHALDHGSAIPVIPVADSMRMIADDGSSSPLERNNARVVQTPQTFLTEVILPAFNCAYSSAFTDDATVVEAHGGKVCLMAGDAENIKITTPSDMIIAEILLKTST